MNYKLKTVIFLLFSLVLFYSIPLQAQEPLGDRMKEKLKSEEFNVTFLLQTFGNVTFTDRNYNSGNGYELDANRLGFRGVLDGKFSYRFQLEYTDAPSISDARMGYHFSDNFEMQVGSFKPRLSADLDPNPGITDFIDRARITGAMMNNREIGITFLGENDRFNYAFGMYNGNRLQNENDGRFLYTGRLSYTFGNEGNSLELGLNGAFNQTKMERVGKSGLTSMGDRELFGIYAEFNRDPLFGTVEYLQTTFDAQELQAEETISGFYATLGTNLSERDQLIARWDHLEYDLLERNSELLILAWKRKITSLFSIHINALALMDSEEYDGENQFGLKANFQFQF
ncbi:MAG: porin [Balneolaceae bacterium]|nr:porin [Balneolaceae bacterium]MDR9409441.1 porin [Balneolaceae bacterium]